MGSNSLKIPTSIFLQALTTRRLVDVTIIYTRFQRFSSEHDVPIFWEVSRYAASPYTSGKHRVSTRKLRASIRRGG